MEIQFHYDKNSLLEDIPAGKYNILANILDRTNALEKIKNLRPQLYEIIKPHMHIALSYKTPTEQLLANLIDKRCKIEQLVQLLRNCELYEALVLLITERIRITSDPTEHLDNNILKVKIGRPMCFEFTVFGIPLPTYQWYKNDTLLVDKTSSQYCMEKYMAEMSGNYYCIAYQMLNNQTIATLCSKTVIVETLTERCVVVKRPLPEINVRKTIMSEHYTLTFHVRGFPPPKYVWYHENLKLEGKCGPSIQISNKPQYEGEYRCIISNEVTEDITEKIIFNVIDPYMLPVSINAVTEKVALLIANEDYKNYNKLETPIRDVMAIKEKLENLNFKVITYYNKDLEHMRKAISFLEALCVEGCYVFFYFVGHGFECGQKYLLPVDAEDSSNFTRKNSINECEILQRILRKKPKLFVTILDMCLSMPNKNTNLEEEEPKYFSYKSHKNLIQGYSTSTGSSAYDFDGTKHSLYNQLLQMQFDLDVPMLQMLLNLNLEFEKVAKKAEINRVSNQIQGKGANNNGPLLDLSDQMPSVYNNLAQDFSLRVDKTGHPATQKVWNVLLELTKKCK